MSTLATAALCLLLSGCTHAATAGAPDVGARKTVTLTLPRSAAEGEAVAARIAAGAVPRGARIIVRLPTGEIAGSVTPYGIRSGQKAGVYTIPLPAGATANGKVTLHLEVKEKRGTRAPTDREVERVELVFLPITR